MRRCFFNKTTGLFQLHLKAKHDFFFPNPDVVLALKPAQICQQCLCKPQIRQMLTFVLNMAYHVT